MERQLIHASEQPSERDPVVSRKVSPEHRVLVSVSKPANRIADFFPPHTFAVKLGAHVQKRPLTGLRPIDLIALSIELTTVFSHQADTDQIKGVRSLYELGVDPIFHALPLPLHNRNAVTLTSKRPPSILCMSFAGNRQECRRERPTMATTRSRRPTSSLIFRRWKWRTQR